MARLAALALLSLMAACADAMGPPPYEVVTVGEASEADEQAAMGALGRWNEAAGGELFIYGGNVGKRADGRINLQLNVDGYDESGRCFDRKNGRGDVTRQDIYVTRTPESVAQPIELIIAHELGHAIGLEHDGEVNNIMASPAPTFAMTDEQIAYAHSLLGK